MKTGFSSFGCYPAFNYVPVPISSAAINQKIPALIGWSLENFLPNSISPRLIFRLSRTPFPGRLRRNSLNVHQLVYWKKRLKQLLGGSFVQISGSNRPVEIHIGNKVKLVVEAGYNAGVIKSLVELLSDVRN